MFLDSDYKDAFLLLILQRVIEYVTKRYTTGKELIKIDHHNNSEDFGDIQYC